MITDDIITGIRSELFKRERKHQNPAKMLGVSGTYLSDILTKHRNTRTAEEHVKHAMAILDIDRRVKTRRETLLRC